MRQPMGKRNVVRKEGARIPISSKASKIPLPAAQEPCTWKHIYVQKCGRYHLTAESVPKSPFPLPEEPLPTKNLVY